MFNLLLKIDKTWDFLVEPPDINHWKIFFLIHILEKTLLVFPRWVPNIHLVEFQPNRRFSYDLIRALGEVVQFYQEDRGQPEAALKELSPN